MTVADRYAGQQGPCAHCGQTITIPQTSATDETAVDRSALVRAWLLIAGACILGLIGLGLVASMVFPLIVSAREDARRRRCADNGREISVAIIAYEKMHGTFPPQYTVDEQNRPLTSWRTHLLPYMEQAARYERYRHDEPWDSPGNKALVEPPIVTYLCPSDVLTHSPVLPISNYLGIVGEQCIFDGARTASHAQISQGGGIFKTILFGETIHARVQWSEPRDIEMRQALDTLGTPQSLLSSYHPDGINMVFADGHSEFMAADSSRRILQALFTIDAD